MAVTTPNGTIVSCLTDNEDGTITLRIHRRSKVNGGKPVLLDEPTAREYAELRTKMRDADRLLDGKFPIPTAPVVPDGATEGETILLLMQHNAAVAECNQQRRDLIRDPELAPYAPVVIEVVRRLADLDITLDDLVPEVFNSSTCGALLDLWEAPLGGPVVPPPNPTVDVAVPEPAMAVPDVEEPPEPVSTEPEPSSPPGTAPSTRSPRRPSTR